MLELLLSGASGDKLEDINSNHESEDQMIVQQMFPPYGLDPNDDFFGDARLFSIWVVWKGLGRYAVQKYTDSTGPQLSRAGNWSQWAVEPFRRKQYRFTYDEACEWAEELRGTLEVNGLTYEQVKQWRQAKDAS